jgi:hypothetical protein
LRKKPRGHDLTNLGGFQLNKQTLLLSVRGPFIGDVFTQNRFAICRDKISEQASSVFKIFKLD